jgi:hypothetical protein
MSSRTSPNVNNSLLIFSFLSCFVKRNISMGTWEHIKMQTSPSITPWVLLLEEIPQNTHRNKKGVVDT